MKCHHKKFVVDATINRIDENAQGECLSYMADIKITCEECKTPFRFKGLRVGVDFKGATASFDGMEGRFAIEPVT